MILAFFAPGLALYAVVLLYPIASALSYSFFQWNGVARAGFSGLANYKAVLTLSPYGQQFQHAALNNAAFFVGTLILQGAGGLLLALALTRMRRLRRLAQTVIAMPYLMSSLVIGYVWAMILSPQWGPVNAVLRAAGLDQLALPWLGEPKLLMPITVLINTWQWVGAGMLIFGAALAGVPEEQIEAAQIDGAGFWRRFFSVQLPQILTSVDVYVVLIFIGAMNVFDLVYAVGGGSSGGPGGAIDVLQTLFYRIAFSGGQNALGLSGALSMLILILTLTFTVAIRAVFASLRRRYT
ncbi:carbohydrate ABC transporter permease [Brachybacterium alimentarium]|uniref:carbohydrate ABC transporter permease n=1 Tax=Brachybacterium alimentarium TaxID=47845 RepID=UPI003FD6A60F